MVESVGEGIWNALNIIGLAIVLVALPQVTTVGLVDPEVLDAYTILISLDALARMFACLSSPLS